MILWFIIVVYHKRGVLWTTHICPSNTRPILLLDKERLFICKKVCKLFKPTSIWNCISWPSLPCCSGYYTGLMYFADLSCFWTVNHQASLSLWKGSRTALQWFESLNSPSLRRGGKSNSSYGFRLSSATSFSSHDIMVLSFRNMAFHITAMLMTLNSTSHSILMIRR